MITLVQSFGREAAAVTAFSQTTRVSAQSYVRLHRREVAFWLLTGLTFAGGAAALFGVGGHLVYRDQFVRHLGPAGLTLGKLSIFLAYSAMLYGPLKALSGASGQAASIGRRACSGCSRCSTANPPSLTVPTGCRGGRGRWSSRTCPSPTGMGPPVLSNVSLTVPSRGAGRGCRPQRGRARRRCLGLMSRLHDPTAGSVRLDGHDLRTLRLADVRRHVAVVSQDAVALPGTVRENIAYGRPTASDAEIRRAAERAGAAGFIAALPDGYDTAVADGGANLSGGQRQRLGHRPRDADRGPDPGAGRSRPAPLTPSKRLRWSRRSATSAACGR